MAVYSEPKKGGFRIKKEYASQIINSRMSKEEYEKIHEKAKKFRDANSSTKVQGKEPLSKKHK